MKVLFVHGFGGEGGGRMEKALHERFEESGHTLVPFRWKAGNLTTMTLQTGGHVLLEALSDINPIRAAARVLYTASQDVGAQWDSALANVAAAHVALRGTLRNLGKAKEPFAIIAFSLGARVVILALHSMKKTPHALRRVVFAGAAVSCAAFDMLPLDLRDGKPARVVNVYSDADHILKGLYAVLQNGGHDAAGVNAVKSRGVTNVKVDTGHLTYPSLAEELRDLAVGLGQT